MLLAFFNSCVCVCEDYVYTLMTQKARIEGRSLRTGVSGNCKASNMGAGEQVGSSGRLVYFL